MPRRNLFHRQWWGRNKEKDLPLRITASPEFIMQKTCAALGHNAAFGAEIKIRNFLWLYSRHYEMMAGRCPVVAPYLKAQLKIFLDLRVS